MDVACCKYDFSSDVGPPCRSRDVECCSVGGDGKVGGAADASYVEPDRDDSAEVGGFCGDVLVGYGEDDVSRGGELVHEFGGEEEGDVGGEVETCFFGSVRRWLLIPISP